ncbi:MAG: GNAT family N-acetyltransferase [Motilibacteraceae bacterium]
MTTSAHDLPAGRPVALTVREVRPDELAAVGEITVAAYVSDGHMPADAGYVHELRAADRRAGRATVLVAAGEDSATQDSVLGAVTYAEHGSEYAELAGPGEAEIRMLAVDPAARGRGAGRALVVACVDRARAAGCTALVLSTQPSMTTAHRIYESLGFTRTPERDWFPVPEVELLAYRLEL